jgi:hypothetical protein
MGWGGWMEMDRGQVFTRYLLIEIELVKSIGVVERTGVRGTLGCRTVGGLER